MVKDCNREAFFELLRAGLWEKEVRLSPSNIIDFKEVLRIAEEQSVVGLVAAGIEHVKGFRLPQADVLTIAGRALQVEQQNIAMNQFVAELFAKLQAENIKALLVKGQGIAQCYERPLWRTAGDVDLLLDYENYAKAKAFLIPISSHVEDEGKKAKHQGLTIEGFSVELHGRMPFLLSKRVDKGIDEVLNNLFYGGNVRSWMNDKTMVFLPSPDNDAILVFTHFLHHFFIEGVGLRQICDWCRLLWTYRETLNRNLLESRIRKMGLLTEWKTYGALAVDTLGMPKDAMPMYDSRYTVKGEKVLKRVLKCGNFGHNNDLSYRAKYKGLKYKMVAMWRRFWDFASLVPVFPVDAPKFFVNYLFAKVK